MHWLAEMAGFEPTLIGVKVRCLTAWLHPCVEPMEGFKPPADWLQISRSIY